MASEHFVLLTTVSKVKKHPKADRLEIVEMGGWQVVPAKGLVKKGDRVLFVPVDSLVPEKWAVEWGVHKYLAGHKHNRVKCVRLQGEPSYGFIVPIPDELKDKKDGTDVKDFFGITKYCPPVRNFSGTQKPGMSHHHPLFDKYTDIENLYNYPNMFKDGELVEVTEKLHGCNVRAGLLDTTLNKTDVWSKLLRLFGIKRTYLGEQWVAGSHNTQIHIGESPETYRYSYMYAQPEIQALIKHLKRRANTKQVIVYGELVGPGIQKLHYGHSKWEYYVFNIKIDGKYIHPENVKDLCRRFKVNQVPILGQFKFDIDIIKSLAEGKSTLDKSHIREGVIVSALENLTTPNGKRRIAKVKGAGYLIWKESKKGSDYTEE